MDKIRIVFFGTPDFAVGILKKLIERNYSIVGVITAPDKPSGRGKKINQSAIKKYAIEQQLSILQPTNLKSKKFLDALKTLNANLQIVVAFRMLPKEVWSMPKFGTFNLHASLLPEYRGAAPINWVIINGESMSGVTTFFIDEKIDTGEIILQEEVNIKDTDTAGNLHDNLMNVGAELVIKTVELIKKGNLKTIKQPITEDLTGIKPLKIAPKIYKEFCKIDWNQSLKDIYNKVRGLSPYPGAWSFIDNIKETIQVKILEATKEETAHKYKPGSVLSNKKELKIATPDGFLKILEIQLSGKRKMTTKELLNGYAFDVNSKAH